MSDHDAVARAMSQHMPPETYPIWFDVRGAIEADLIKRPV
jgi:hypothetical protein